jgi:hypothetical protein
MENQKIVKSTGNYKIGTICKDKDLIYYADLTLTAIGKQDHEMIAGIDEKVLAILSQCHSSYLFYSEWLSLTNKYGFLINVWPKEGLDPSYIEQELEKIKKSLKYIISDASVKRLPKNVSFPDKDRDSSSNQFKNFFVLDPNY